MGVVSEAFRRQVERADDVLQGPVQLADRAEVRHVGLDLRGLRRVRELLEEVSRARWTSRSSTTEGSFSKRASRAARPSGGNAVRMCSTRSCLCRRTVSRINSVSV